MTIPIAHAGHWLTSIAYFPIVAFLVWLGITQWRERRARGKPAKREPED